MKDELNKVVIYTDGACSGNPGPGGWAAVLLFDDNEKTICGNDSDTTNNRMELTAVIEALKLLKVAYNVDLYTDSVYVKDGITLWIRKWKVNGWKTANKMPVKNLELWLELDSLANFHKVTWYWVRAHVGDLYNQKADMLARSQIVR
ncbi:RNase H family protein [Ehrlichia chaffeensis str. Heartland]|uniref:Ribonuclease H n=1 Tax=Ehrlichia chaffeensis (strain ATCC CRL-10679 / Arkansas) TaxID=205920 RepID=RNH_EHRCR|nr:ribonuclease HI [Ehrlichia chaffeensis]Q2GHJ9.1 RecName: Full=Ribonuclease H; Short=RNase H [Ehrlichia chaffeensis str. Arkansas]ABD44596.1 ribonuclease HI [Ehrlichia chaffeensis str. Arkansas]AHX03385.1 RNase H family protein [Ehrlichia chaffeensis str. Heartland]AHX05894.1 RNase H family protein [Ehrlichia chaffeensis str. Jax]AHX06886.1 RNase H family protein [Ehrlichia chaffeensis str. Liberty]AHX07141.1 RNase H family protein [Ehrlichia chaffeensis str. Osceola]